MTTPYPRLAISRILRSCILFLLAALLAFPTFLEAAATAKKATPKKSSSTARKAPAKKAPVKKASTAKKRSTRARTTRARRSTRSVRRGPSSPSTDRLKEIQAALAGAGFYPGEPDGKWGDQSIEAMKKFQEAHSLKPTGKINSLSLIALGLGPKRGPAPGMASVLAPPEASPEEKSDH